MLRDCKTADEVREVYREVRARMAALRPPSPPEPESEPRSPIDLPPEWRPQQRGRLTVKDIQRCVCDRYGVTMEELLGNGRTRRMLRPRHIAVWLIQRLMGMSLSQVALQMRRDHTTILHVARMMAWKLEQDGQLRDEVDEIEARLRQACCTE